MALSTLKSERVCIQKMFVWEIDAVCFQDLKAGMHSPKMTAFDPYNGTKYTGVFKFSQETYGGVNFSIDINPVPGVIKYYYCLDNGDLKEGRTFYAVKNKLEVYVDITGYRHQPYQLLTQLCGNGAINTLEKLKQLWKNDPSLKFLIKCKGTTIEAIKPIMTACSPVFKAMFDRDWKESIGNSIEITDFAPEVVQKMVDFCENGTLVDFEKCDELYKIADKYDIPELMKLALSKFAETMTVENIYARLQMAKLFKMKNLKKLCIIFCVQNCITDY